MHARFRVLQVCSAKNEEMKMGLLAAAVFLAIASGSVAQSKLNVVQLEELILLLCVLCILYSHS